MPRILNTLLTSGAFLALHSSSALACEPLDIEGRLAEAMTQTESTAAALAPLNALWAQLPDACDPPTSKQIAEIAQHAGYIALEGGAEGDALLWFERSARLAPDVEVSGALGDGARASLASAKATVKASPTAQIRASEPMRLNGVAVDAGHIRTVPVGEHLLVTGEGSGTPSGAWVTAGAGEMMVFPPVAGTPAPPELAERQWALPRPQPVQVALLAGGGAALLAGGASLWFATNNGPWQACKTLDADNELPSNGWAGMGRCDDALGGHLRARHVGSIGLMTVGGLAIGSAGLWIAPVALNNGGGGFAIGGRW